MECNEKLIEIVEDHALVNHFIDSVACAIENGTEMPNFVPVLNDTVESDNLSRIAEEITNLRKKVHEA